jgi:hypothetical protein
VHYLAADFIFKAVFFRRHLHEFLPLRINHYESD